MSPIDECLRPNVAGHDALRALTASDADPLPVMEGDHIVGLLHKSDIARWLALHQLDAHEHR